jgi:cell fate regulator YaaT (PSP1 superfamily)
MTRVVALKFQEAGRQYDFNAQDLELRRADRVIVETDRGRAMAIVVTPPREVAAGEVPQGLKSILRAATDDDLAMAENNAAREDEARSYCVERIHARKLEMKLVRAEYAFDGSKITFSFTADGRIDFRELVKDLAHHFHTRIEMRQIGVRDEAKLVGGLGICGRELCCCSFLTQFNPVSVKMAKEQGLALNPSKISGQCGRLLCCLSYEFETYRELRKGLPKCGKKVEWQGHECTVTNQDILRQQVTLRDGAGKCCCVTTEELRTGEARQPQPDEQVDGDQHSSRMQRRRPNQQRERKPSERKPSGGSGGDKRRRQEPKDSAEGSSSGERDKARKRPPRARQGQDQRRKQPKQAQVEAGKAQEKAERPQQQKQDAAESKNKSRRRRRNRRRTRGPRPQGPGSQPGNQGE